MGIRSKVGRIATHGALAASLLALGVGLAGTPKAVRAQELTLRAADPTQQGSLSPEAAAALIARGPLPFSEADVAAKAAADRAHADLVRSGALLLPPSRSELAAAGVGLRRAEAPTIVGTLNFAGQSNPNLSPSDSTGAIGPTRYIQLVNANAAIYNRTTKAIIASGTLDQLAGQASTVNSFDPQIIWDPGTNRFYYAMDSIFSATSNVLSFGFSTTATPANVTTNWCHYQVSFGIPFPDYPKLGHSAFFAVIGFNEFANNSSGGFVGSGLVALSKPPAGTTCPSASTFKFGAISNLKDTTGKQVFTPVPANQVDPLTTGYVVTRNGGLPATKLWLFSVTKSATGTPVFGGARGVTVASYTVPPSATQPTFTQKLDTLDARPMNAVQAFDPKLKTFSLWTQHTIASGTASAVRFYEINPVPAAPVLQRSTNITATNTFLFNGSVSPDRKKNGAATAFGNNVVVNYSVSSPSIPARIVAASSLNNGPLAFVKVKNGVGPYRDFTCKNAGNICRWGDYSGASPDPAPTTGSSTSGEVWGTNQYSGVVNPGTSIANWRTQIFAVKP